MVRFGLVAGLLMFATQGVAAEPLKEITSNTDPLDIEGNSAPYYHVSCRSHHCLSAIGFFTTDDFVWAPRVSITVGVSNHQNYQGGVRSGFSATRREAVTLAQ